MPVQRTDVDKRRYAKGRPAEVQWHPFFVVASFGRLKRRTHLPVRPYIAGPLHRRPARIAAVSACVFLIGVAGQDNHAVASEDKKIKPKLKEIKVTQKILYYLCLVRIPE